MSILFKFIILPEFRSVPRTQKNGKILFCNTYFALITKIWKTKCFARIYMHKFRDFRNFSEIGQSSKVVFWSNLSVDNLYVLKFIVVSDSCRSSDPSRSLPYPGNDFSVEVIMSHFPPRIFILQFPSEFRWKKIPMWNPICTVWIASHICMYFQTSIQPCPPYWPHSK